MDLSWRESGTVNLIFGPQIRFYEPEYRASDRILQNLKNTNLAVRVTRA
jgi:hypothetical protein